MKTLLIPIAIFVLAGGGPIPSEPISELVDENLDIPDFMRKARR